MRLSLGPDLRRGWPTLRDQCLAAAAAGWDGVWLFDHLRVPPDEPSPGFFLEAWSTLGAVAALAPGLRVGTLVSANTLRAPPLVAAMALTLHAVSGGRFVLGLGAGGDEDEHARLGLDFPPIGERLDRLDEACTVIRRLLSPGPAHVAGRHYRIDVPETGVAAGVRIPLLVGASGPRGLDIAARHADAWLVWGSVDDMVRLGATLDARCRAHGRDPATVERGVQVMLEPGDPGPEQRRALAERWPAVLTGGPGELVDTLGRYRAAGVGEVVVCDYALPAGRRDDLLSGLLALARTSQ
ncbi:MAG TPA: LLM class flavin-dependent oxidoreductase [Acidimicrobiales bacterium]